MDNVLVQPCNATKHDKHIMKNDCPTNSCRTVEVLDVIDHDNKKPLNVATLVMQMLTKKTSFTWSEEGSYL